VIIFQESHQSYGDFPFKKPSNPMLILRDNNKRLENRLGNKGYVEKGL